MLLSLLVLISPVFFLTVKHWTNLVVLFLFICCTYLLAVDKKPNSAFSNSGVCAKLIYLIFVAHLAAIAISQLFRLDFYSPNWDAPLRLVMCTPIFLAIANGRLKSFSSQSISLHWLTLVFPLTLIWTLFLELTGLQVGALKTSPLTLSTRYLLAAIPFYFHLLLY